MEYIQEWRQKLPKREVVMAKLSELKDSVMHSRQKRFYITFALLLATCLLLLVIRTHSYQMLSISDADNLYECGCPTTDGETELHQMTR